MPQHTVRKLAPTDRAALEGVLRSDDTFNEAEIAVALELVDDGLANPKSDYWFRLATRQRGGEEFVAGYICYGPTPMTEASYDLYWIVTHREARGQGVASLLIETMETDLAARDASGVRIETSHLESYGAARKLYDRHAYTEVARIDDFYKPGDALVTFYKRL